MSKSFYIVDGHSQFYRFFHAPGLNLISASGEPVTATYGFCKMLLKLIREKKPDYLAVAMDGPRSLLFRRRLDSQYKANRSEKADPTIYSQLKRIREIMSALPICHLQMDGWEADDIIATLHARTLPDNVQVNIITGDKDISYLLTFPNVKLFDPQKNEYTDGGHFVSRKGYQPNLVPQVLALTGDASDNIPTIKLPKSPGFGEKTAVKYLKEFGSLDELVANRGELPLRLFTPLDEAVKNGRLELNKTLVKLDNTVPLDWKLKDANLDKFSVKNAAHIFEELGFSRWS